ncbi:putative beta-lysine N-acetyltransferase [Pseudalkalibacillus hwajinpoensis]|uniref:Putative beta-lysine N-acetyltransferase n=1 Tax=Guptibacillus hwajinpoensis TaxID=208199 RepID=A0A4U1MLW5_9BACL|nr:putative beta-lysine N-acetyltransferase [Pseudalkalibacillus hwajinpoensis]TKD71552.1 putative beta-lysine N-acetyltransferase [Pseudalkalibacillus hwajinpoensis]
MNQERSEAVSRVYKGCDYSFSCTHDLFNERIRIDEYSGNVKAMTNHIHSLFTEGYTKCIIKAKEGDIRKLLSLGLSYEGMIRHYFSGVDAHMMTKYRDNWRRNSQTWKDEDVILEGVLTKTPSEISGKPLMRPGRESDAPALAELYKEVFAVYPTPMDEPAYIRKVMKDNTIFHVLEENGRIISAASAEMNRKFKNAEITDCATLPKFRKGGTMRHLIIELEKKLLEEDIYYAYSIARSLSFGMNAVFQQLNYEYGGRLINNVKIYQDWENMNLWSKSLTCGAE